MTAPRPRRQPVAVSLNKIDLQRMMCYPRLMSREQAAELYRKRGGDLVERMERPRTRWVNYCASVVAEFDLRPEVRARARELLALVDDARRELMSKYYDRTRRP